MLLSEPFWRREFGAAPDVVGKVVSLVWPAGRAHIIHRPADFEDVPAP